MEIECGNGVMVKYIASQYPGVNVVGIEPLLSGEYAMGDFNRAGGEESGYNWKIQEGDALSIPYEDNSFDLVISVATFEHIPNLDKCLAEIKRVLKPGGIFYTEFGPVWSGIIGHHCRNWVKQYILSIPPWAHLYMQEDELYAYISVNESEEKAQEICNMVYHDEWINRIDLQSMKKSFYACGMKVLELKENTLVNRLGWIDGTNANELNDEILHKVEGRYTKEELEVCSLNLLMEKE